MTSIWRAGEITIDGKGHQRDQLPLPDDIGEALVAYLEKRGAAEVRRVFLTPRAPIRPIEAAGVSTAVRRAYLRAGLRPVAAHQLRHALASSLVREGASLIAVGQILRAPASGEHTDLREGRPRTAQARRSPMAGDGTMTSFAEHVEACLRLRRALGFKLIEHEPLLRPFAAHLDAAGVEVITTEIAVAWATERDLPSESSVPGTRCFRANSTSISCGWPAV